MCGKGSTLAEGLLYSGDPAHYKTELAETAALTPGDVQAAMQQWLGRPSYTLVVEPGERTLDGANLGGWSDDGSTAAPPPDPKKPVPPTAEGPPREAPPVAPVGRADLPASRTRHAVQRHSGLARPAQRDSQGRACRSISTPDMPPTAQPTPAPSR